MKKIIIILITLIILGVVGYSLYYFYLKTNYYVVSNGADISEATGPAILKKDPSKCLKIRMPFLSRYEPMSPGYSEKTQIARCYTEVAVALKDPEICEKSSGKDSCFYRIATELRDLLICQRISPFSNSEDSCYSYFLQEKGSESLCREITEAEGRRERCYSIYQSIRRI